MAAVARPAYDANGYRAPIYDVYELTAEELQDVAQLHAETFRSENNWNIAKYTIFSWAIPLFLLIGAIFATIVASEYLPDTGLTSITAGGLSGTVCVVGVILTAMAAVYVPGSHRDQQELENLVNMKVKAKFRSRIADKLPKPEGLAPVAPGGA